MLASKATPGALTLYGGPVADVTRAASSLVIPVRPAGHEPHSRVARSLRLGAAVEG